MEVIVGATLGVFILLLLLVYKHLTRFYGILEALGIPVIAPFLCFGSPPFNYHKVHAEKEDEANYRKFKSFTWGFYWGSQPCMVTMDPKIIKEVFVKQFTNFSERESGFILEDKYLTLDQAGGEKWKAQRKFLSPTFTSGKLKLMSKLIVDETDKLVMHIQHKIKDFPQKKGAVINMRNIFHAYSMDVIGQCAFGASFGCLGKEDINRENKIFKSGLEVFSSLTVTSAFQSYFMHLYFLFPAFYNIMPDFPTDVYDFINKTTKSIIKERDEKAMEDQGDFMDRLRFMIRKIRESDKDKVDGLNEEMVIAQGIIFLAAGFETSASTMSLLIYALAKHKTAQEKCYDEISNIVSEGSEITHDTIADMPYLEACIQETCRLYPIVIRNQRYCTKDSDIDGMQIRKGTTVIVPTWAMHRNPEIFGQDAGEFVPERFLEGAANEYMSNHTFHAFGGGPRTCIGMRFAMTEMKIAVSKLLLNFSIQDEPGVTKLDFDKGSFFMLSYPDMQVRIKKRTPEEEE